MITDYVITQVFEHWAADHHLGRGLPVSVNLSTRDLLDAELPARVDLLTKHWAIDQRWLTFEITETAAIADATTAGTVVAMLRKAGSKVAIDDFGTGYFSLVGLSRLSIDELKIDCRFVHAMLEHQRDAMIVRSIIRLGHDLGLTVVAEGVDSPGVVRELRELGCDEAQGNHLGRPMAMFELRRWLAARSSIAGPGIAGPEAQPRPARVAADVAEQPV